MSIRIVNCSQCGKELYYEKKNEYHLTLVEYRYYGFCKKCKSLLDKEDTYSFCSYECLKRWLKHRVVIV